MTEQHPTQTDRLDEIIGEYLDWVAEKPGITPGEKRALQRELIGRYSEYSEALQSFFEGENSLKEQMSLFFGEQNGAITMDAPTTLDIPGYEILGKVGQGGMGYVYKARQKPPLERIVALKVCATHLAPMEKERFLQEQKFLAKLQGTNIVPILTAGTHEGWQYFTMDFIDGISLEVIPKVSLLRGSTKQLETLAKIVRETVETTGTTSQSPTQIRTDTTPDVNSVIAPTSTDNTFEPIAQLPSIETRKIRLSRSYIRSAAEVVADAATTLQYAHNLGIIHRDLKPSNIMLDRNGRCWLIDFGVAGLMKQALNIENTDWQKHQEHQDRTKPGTILGTCAYMAPERFQGIADEQTDVYSLGVILYELLTLRQAFPGQSREEIKEKIVTSNYPPLKDQTANIPGDLQAICQKAMASDPRDRYSTAADFAEDLQNWLYARPINARPSGLLKRTRLWMRRNRVWAVALFVVVFFSLILVSGALAFFQAKATHGENLAKVQTARADEAEFQKRILNIRDLRSSERNAGWSMDAWNHVRVAAKIKKNEQLRDLSTATLIGLDARKARTIARSATSLAFHPNKDELLMAGEDGNVTSWSQNELSLKNVSVNASGLLAYRDANEPAQLVQRSALSFELTDLRNQKPLQKFELPVPKMQKQTLQSSRAQMAIAKNVATVAVSCQLSNGKNKVAVWDTKSGKLLADLDRSTTVIALSPDSQLLAMGFANGAIEVWHISQKKVLCSLRANSNTISALSFGADLRNRQSLQEKAIPWVLSAGEAGGNIIVWDLALKIPLSYCRASLHAVNALAFSPDGLLLASAGRYHARIWDVPTGRMLLQLDFADTMTCLAFSNDGRQLAVGSVTIDPKKYPGQVIVWDLLRNRGIQEMRGLSGLVTRTVLSPDGTHLAALSQGWEVGIWDIRTGRMLHLLDVPQGFFTDNCDMAFHPDNSILAFSSGRSATTWNVESGKKLQTWQLPPGLQDHLGFHPSGKLLLFRVETSQRPELGPFSNNRDDPRICRVRALGSDQSARVLYELKDFNRGIYPSAGTTDATVFLIDGLQQKGNLRQRSLMAVDGISGKTLWKKPIDHDLGSSFLSIDPSNSYLSFSEGTPISHIVELRSGKIVRSLDDHWIEYLGAKGDYWANNGPADALRRNLGMRLFRTGQRNPIVTLGVDLPTAGRDTARFSSNGTLFAWPGVEGNVFVADLPRIQEKLAEIGMDW